MLNKENFKKIILPGAIITLVFCLIVNIKSGIQYKKYQSIINQKISVIINQIEKQYPNIKDEDVIKILASTDKEENNLLQKYGYKEDETYIKKLEDEFNKDKKNQIIIYFIFSIILIIMFLIYNKRKDKRINQVQKYLKKLNSGIYDLEIEDNKEDELSILKNELYKTTILLKEIAKNSEKEKENLSNSLADISHQLKTPITSIRIMIDDIQENPDMDEQTKKEFVTEISKQVDWISSLIITLLKLAKFDAGSIIMEDKDIKVKDIINKVVSNLEILIDIKNIKIEQKIDDDIEIKADYNWQIEAFTNIIKNAIEHSKQDSTIYINAEKNSLFVKITIRDEGEGIDKKDIKHIFERFYKIGEGSENSIGIGLSLANTIIEKENGYIKVDSEIGKGTTFEIEFVK